MSKQIISDASWLPLRVYSGVADNERKDAFTRDISEFGDRILIDKNPGDTNYTIFKFHIWSVYVHFSIINNFIQKFNYCIIGKELKYDNLINLLIMVKNAGDGFRDILIRNLPYIDRWTILDTGSTDNTIAIIKDVLKGKRGNLYQESFINFRDSRNRLLELAGTDCAFNIMLDDTYVLNGDLRGFLSFVRGDDVADSYSLVIEGVDVLYTSNRITKSSRGLKYINIIHEIIQTENNINISIPHKVAYITDVISPYMTRRTTERKDKDIGLLYNIIRENPLDYRAYYYLADSYILKQNWPLALKYFKERAKYRDKGNLMEVQNSLYYIAVISHNYMNEKWAECHQLYLDCYNFDTTRSESLYFIAKHYLDNGNRDIGTMYLKKAYSIPFPEITMTVRKDIYNYYIPFDLMNLCYENGDYSLGEHCCVKVLSFKNDDQLARRWYDIFKLLNKNKSGVKQKLRFTVNDQLLISFVCPGGWDSWDGETLHTRGLGGSETFVVKYAEGIAKMTDNKVIVFCNCAKNYREYNGVFYINIEEYTDFSKNYYIDYVFINRYAEYVPISVVNKIENIYLILHDLLLPCTIIPNVPSLKAVLCISEWHKKHFLQQFSLFKNKTQVISYGVDLSSFLIKKRQRYNFIYPSFPNRGLLQLLQMFPKIRRKYPSAVLNIFCDLDHKWTNSHSADLIAYIKDLLKEQKHSVINHGWVNYTTLREFWSCAHVWLYPTTYVETCCLTAYEAAASKTLVVSNNGAGLDESIGERGLVVPGDSRLEEWQNECLEKLFNLLDNEPKEEERLINTNYEWINTKKYDLLIEDFINRFL
uniref:Glycosyl transferase family 1 domain-containing protein n=1 Tax=viral metagenome TaxID=1070528 RepID=A0A6C0CZW3_9ZZZZ